MMRKLIRAWRLILIVAVLVLVALAVFWHDSASPAAVDGDYRWRFTEWGDGAQTQVVLIYNGESHTLGTYEGTCAIEKGDYLEYEKSRVVCFSGVRGREIGVFEEPGQTVVRVGDIDEGASGVPGFRGNFTLLKRI